MPTRREFLAAASAAAAVLATARHAEAGLTSAAKATQSRTGLARLGVGLFTVPKALETDFDATLAMIAGLGYKEVEFFGPYPFSVESAQVSWAQTAKQLGFTGSGFFGRTARQVRASLDAHGLTSPSMHVELETLRDRTEQVGEAAHAIGWKYCGIPSIPEDQRRTLDDYRRMAEVFNTIGARAKPMGFKVLYHNHGYGLAPMENGQVPEQVLRDRLDPDLVALEMDVYWTVAGGANPVELLDAYPKLYRLMHVKDMKEIRHFAHGGTMQDWISLFPYMTTAGAGVLDLPRILGHAQKNGVEHFYVEQDLAPDPAAQLGVSIRYLQGAQLRTD